METMQQTLNLVAQILQQQQVNRQMALDEQIMKQQELMSRNMVVLRILKMMAEDDPEAFLESFEQATMATGLDKSSWAAKVRVLLVGPIQAAYRAPSCLAAQDYDHVKEQILYSLDITPENYQQMFCARKKKEDKTPWVLLQKLTDLQERWIQPTRAAWEEIMDAFLLEQFLVDLEQNTQRWVRRHHPKTSQEALQLAEGFDCAQNEIPQDKPGTLMSTKPNKRRGDQEGRTPTQVLLSGSTCFHCGKKGHFSQE
ncbi:hypothetical protein Y1Q_0005313 [Alligator mississippiensis]|uniref:SCAN box domain-containing protein n=1 Tax=Alligator mississippiensis TaxID=8496 RepID=A0A151MTG9_ALLMI|nr:hypothetical protein Y1Q_0005313 [Alligator mississippiensis]